MKNFYMILLSIALVALGSCDKTDRKDIFSVATIFEKSFLKDDLNKLRPFTEGNWDTLISRNNEEIKKIQTFFKNSGYKKIEVDTSGSWLWKYCDISYLQKNEYYEVSFSYSRDSLNNILIDGFYFNNINEACQKYENEPYCPKSKISFKRISWSTDYYATSFRKGAIELQNNTETDIDYIKFRVILAKGKSSYYLGETFFNQTVESYKPIYKGDIVSIEVPGMSDFYAGFKIEKENLQFDAQLIEIKPKPESDWCKKIKRLDDKVKTMINK